MLSVLAVEIDGLTLRAAVVRRSLRGLTVSDCVTIERSEDSELLTAADLSMLIFRIADCPKNVVLVSPLVNVVDVTLDQKKVSRLKPHQLKEVLRWEAEPYMTSAAAESLIGYHLGPAAGDGELRIWVYALAKEDYRNLREALAASGLRLRQVYSPEACFAVAAKLLDGGKERVVIDLGRQAVRAALLKEGRMSAFRTLPVSLAAIRAHLDGLTSPGLESSLLQVLKEWGTEGRTFVLTGPGASEAHIAPFFRDLLGFKATALQLEAKGTVTPEYAAALGAALRRLRVFSRAEAAGLDDSVELGLLIRQRVQILPIVTVLTILALFFSHYFYQREQLNYISAEASLLSERKEEYTALQNQITTLEGQRASLQQKVAFLEGKALDGERLLFLLLSVVARNRGPGGFSLLRAEYLPGDQILLEGQASSPAGVSLLALALQEGDWCKHVVMESVIQGEINKKISRTLLHEQGEPEVVTLELKQFVYNFKLRVALDRDVALGLPDLRPKNGGAGGK